MDSTLPDDAWKDSFDRLLDPRPQLRERNIIKKNVRASFNIDSSVENSNPNLLSFTEFSSQKPQAIDTADKLDIKKRGNSISTPSEKRLSSNLFHCALSPITGLKLDGLQNADQLKGAEKKQTRRTAKQVIFEVNTLSPEKSSDSIVENKRLRLMLPNNGFRQSRSSLVLQPGKWRKSLISWRRTNLNEVPPGVLSPKPSFIPRAVTSEGLVACHIAQRTSAHLNEISEPNKKINYEKEVLKYCAQSKPYKFSTAYASGKMIDPCKIGEGVYGEVFKYAQKNSTRTDIVMKVLPIEGTALVNEEIQKTFEQILPEIIISQELSKLRTNKTNSTSGFVDIYNVCLVKGKYPKHLLSLWEEYDEEKESENDHPKMFTDNQLFIVLELKFAGQDMSAFTFLNAEQSYFSLQQIILTLAVGEEAFQFEHRDLHWGNILIEKTDKKQIDFKLCGRDLSVASKGIKITIIDYTLSRITVADCCHYNDLSQDDDLFVATGDYQYDIYRMMRDELKNNWSSYSPKTNVQWLSYVNSKLIDGVNYKNVNTKVHKTYMQKLKAFKKIILTFGSAVDCVRHLHSFN